jgi:hypothetical protein
MKVTIGTDIVNASPGEVLSDNHYKLIRELADELTERLRKTDIAAVVQSLRVLPTHQVYVHKRCPASVKIKVLCESGAFGSKIEREFDEETVLSQQGSTVVDEANRIMAILNKYFAVVARDHERVARLFRRFAELTEAKDAA